jgi:hypothetical protein
MKSSNRVSKNRPTPWLSARALVERFPKPEEAPRTLQILQNSCGPHVLWCVLKFLGVRASGAGVVKCCKHTRAGTFPICLAVAARTYGLEVRFHTERDPAIQSDEARCYRKAAALGIPILPPLSLNELLATIRQGFIPIVFYQETDGEGHFSPILWLARGRLLMPYANTPGMSPAQFVPRWRAPGFCRQCILVRKPLEPGLKPTKRGGASRR